MIIGKKEKFAVELEISNRAEYVMGYVQIWLNNQFVGSREEEVMLSSFVASLARIATKDDICCDDFSLGDFKKEYQLIQNGDSVHDDCLGGLGEAFDDFEVFFYRRNGMVRFFWRLHENPFHVYPGYGHDLRCEDVDATEIDDVLKALRLELDK
jgi:hypothetical protein